MSEGKRHQAAREYLESQGFKLISTVYTTLDSPIEIECEKGHRFQNTMREFRKVPICPICASNPFETSKETSTNRKKKGYRVLGIDQATVKSGWAVFEGLELIAHGVISIDDKLSTATRISQVNEELIRKINQFEPDKVLIEDIQLQEGPNQNALGVTTFKVLAELLGVLQNTLETYQIEYEIVPPATWRAAAGVKGRSRSDKKKSGQLIVKQLYNTIFSNDESDAILIARYGAKANIKEPDIISWE